MKTSASRYDLSWAAVEFVNLTLYHLPILTVCVFVALGEQHFEEALNLHKAMVFVQRRLDLLGQEVKFVYGAQK